jgi:hypothetical protein
MPDMPGRRRRRGATVPNARRPGDLMGVRARGRSTQRRAWPWPVSDRSASRSTGTVERSLVRVRPGPPHVRERNVVILLVAPHAPEEVAGARFVRLIGDLCPLVACQLTNGESLEVVQRTRSSAREGPGRRVPEVTLESRSLGRCSGFIIRTAHPASFGVGGSVCCQGVRTPRWSASAFSTARASMRTAHAPRARPWTGSPRSSLIAGPGRRETGPWPAGRS